MFFGLFETETDRAIRRSEEVIKRAEAQLEELDSWKQGFEDKMGEDYKRFAKKCRENPGYLEKVKELYRKRRSSK